MRGLTQHHYIFGAFLLDPVEKVLLRNNQPVHLPSKAFETLLALVEKDGHILEKTELLNRVWPNTFVEEATLAQNIFTLRKTLGQAEGQEFIETVPKRGYRFVAPLRTVEPSGSCHLLETVSAAPKPKSRRVWAISFVVFVVLGASSWLAWRPYRRHERPAASRMMLAVIPFENLSGDPGQDYFCDGLTEDLITKFGSLSPDRLGVIARTSTMRYKGSDKNASQIGHELGVEYIVEGSVVRANQRVRINAQLIRTQDQTHVWAQSYERDLGGILALQDDVAAAIADAVEFKLGKPRLPGGPAQETENWAAYEAYLEGRYFWNKRSEEGFRRAIEHFDQAIAEDPGYAQAYSGLADAFALLGSNPTAAISRHDAMEKAREAAHKALALNNELVEAHTSLAFVYWHYDWNWPAAEKEFQRALQLNPSYPTAHHWYAYFLISQGRTEQALEEIRRAQEADPLSLIINTDAAEILFYARRYDEAISQARKVLEMDPSFPLALNIEAWSHVQERQYAEAIEELKNGVNAPGGHFLETTLGATYAVAGQREQALKLLGQLLDESKTRHIGELWIGIASIYNALGNRNEAVTWLEKAFQERDGGLTLIQLLPFFDSLHADPRFEDLARRIGLPPVPLSAHTDNT